MERQMGHKEKRQKRLKINKEYTTLSFTRWKMKVKPGKGYCKKDRAKNRVIVWAKEDNTKIPQLLQACQLQSQ